MHFVVRSELPMAALNSLVTEAVDVVVHCGRHQGVIQVTEVAAVEDLQAGPEATTFTLTELFRRERPGGPLTWTGNLPARAARALEMAGVDVRHLLSTESPAAATEDVAAPAARPRRRARTT